MYNPTKQNSRLNVESQSRYNYYDSQPQGYNESPTRKRGASKLASSKRITQVAQKIQDVIEICIGDRNEGSNEFESVINAERGILDLLVGSDLHQVHLPGGATSHYTNNPNYRPPQGGFTGTNTGFVGGNTGFGGQNHKGSKPFLDISQTPGPRQQNPTVRAQLANNPRAIIGDDALQMIEQIERKALLQIDHLKRQKNELLLRLNNEALLHGDEKRRREWCEGELKKVIAFLEQQGYRIGPIQFPDWYYQSSVQQGQPQQVKQPQQQSYTIGGGQSQNGGFFQQGGQHRPQSPNNNYNIGAVPTFAQPQFNQNQYNQTGFGQSGLDRSVHGPRPHSPNPEQVQSTYQIGNNAYSNNQIPTSGFNPQGTQQYGGFNQDVSYHQGRPQSPNGQYVNTRQGIQQLHQQAQNMRDNVSNNYDGPPEDFNVLQQRLLAAEQKARNYEREMDRWKMEASRRGQYPGILELLQETERIRVETIKLLKLKQAGKLGGGNRGGVAEYEQENSKSRHENYNGRSRKAPAKGSFETNALSPKSEFHSMLDEMKRVTRG